MHTNRYQVRPLGIVSITDLDAALFAGDGAPRDTDAPGDIIHDNTRKAGFAATALVAYAAHVGDAYEDLHVIIADFVADLHHLADALDIDLADAISDARSHYWAEIGQAEERRSVAHYGTARKMKGRNNMPEVKLSKLTKDNVRALKETMSDEQSAHVRLTATTARFEMSAKEAAIMVSYLQSQAAQDHGATGHPYKSLTAVRRKLEALEAAEASPSCSPPAQKGPKVLTELLRLDSSE